MFDVKTQREKQLSGDTRAGWSARTSIRQRHRSVLTSQWRPLLLLGVLMVAVFAVASMCTNSPLERGLILGSGITLALGGVTALVVLTAGTAPLFMGEMAEQWTAQELRPVTAHGWKLVNHFGLGSGDQDHVLVGPGGVLLIETKWGATPWDFDQRDHFFQQALSQVLRNARQLQAWHGVAAHGRPRVQPVLVLWGSANTKLADAAPRRHDSGVVVMSGDRLREWALRLGRDQLTQEQTEAIWQAMDRHVEKRDEYEARTRPMPRSVPELVQTVVAASVLALLGLLATAQLLVQTGSMTLWVLVGPLLIGMLELVRRQTGWRWQTRALQAGAASTYLLGAGDAAVSLLHP